MPQTKRTTGTRHSRSNFDEIHLKIGVNFKFEIIAGICLLTPMKMTSFLKKCIDWWIFD